MYRGARVKKKGFIYIFTIIIISLLAVIFYFIYQSSYTSIQVAKNRQKKIQADYYAESLINLALSQDNFLENLKSYYEEAKSHKKGIEKRINPTIDISDLNDERIILKLWKTGEFKLESECTYKKINSKYGLEGTYINQAYKKKKAILNSSNIKNEDLNEIVQGFEKIKNSQADLNCKIFEIEGNYKIKDSGAFFKLYEEIELDNEEKEEITKALISYRDIIYLKNGSLEIVGKIKFKNLFIINGKIYNDNFRNEGVIYLDREGQINSPTILKGYLIDPFDRAGSISVKLDETIINDYDKILPGYFKLQIKNLRSFGE